MVMALPVVVPVLDVAPLAAGAPDEPAALALLLLLVHAVSAAPAPSAVAPMRNLRRPMLGVDSDMYASDGFTSRDLGF
jgi:hypothetical protein